MKEGAAYHWHAFSADRSEVQVGTPIGWPAGWGMTRYQQELSVDFGRAFFYTDIQWSIYINVSQGFKESGNAG
jgi:hypothetical protein